MITREKFTEILDVDGGAFTNGHIDYTMKALTLLRERIPYEVCDEIVQGADRGAVYLCDIKDVLPYISVEDAYILADCNLYIDKKLDCLGFDC